VLKLIGSKNVLGHGVYQSEADKRNGHPRRQQKPQRMGKTFQVRAGVATSSQSSSPKSTVYPSLLDATDREHLHCDIDAEVEHTVKMVSTVISSSKTDVVTEDCAKWQAMNEEQGMQESSPALEMNPPTLARHDATEGSDLQSAAAPSASLVCDHNSGAAETRPADDHLDTSEAVIWSGKQADRATDADVLAASVEGGGSSSSDDLCRKGSGVASKPEGSSGDTFASAWISAPMLQNEVGSLVMPNTWRYVPPPRLPVSGLEPPSEAIGQVKRVESESAGKHELEDVSKRQLVAELVDQLVARSQRVEDKLGAELRSGRAMRVSLEVLQRQNVCLQQQLI
jgi:hypothetical protein